jgi:signal transduction histidine kinase
MSNPPLDDWQRPGPTARQRRIDLYIGLAVAAAAVINVTAFRGMGVSVFGTVPGAAEHYAWALAVTLPLIWRRTHPEIALLIIAPVFIAGQVRGTQEIQIASGTLFAAIYAVGAWGRSRDRARWLRLATIASMFVWLGVSFLMSIDEIRASTRPDADGPFTPLLAALINGVLTNALIFGFAYLVGETAWLAARRQHQLEQQAAELRAAQEQAKERAVFGERVRIARELHDVVAHHVSVMGIQASAARRAMDKDPGKTRTALAAVEDSARTAVDELRRMLGALRASSSGPEPSAAAGLERLDEMITRVREAGLTGTLTVYGDPVPVPESVSQAAYRIVQEAVTNTLKHAHATAVDVRIRYLARELEIDVADDGRGSGPASAGGMGLIGMRERAAVHEGTVEAGPRSEGGYRVRARLPLQREMAVQA